MRLYDAAYEDVRKPCAVAVQGTRSSHSFQDIQNALKQQQQQILGSRANWQSALEDNAGEAASSRMVHPIAGVRPLNAGELPLAPIEYAAKLIAESGVWKSKEQYLAALFILQPLQQAWDCADLKISQVSYWS